MGDLVHNQARHALADLKQDLEHPLSVRLLSIQCNELVAPPGLDPGPGSLDRVEVGGAGRHELQGATAFLNVLSNIDGPVRPVVIHHNDFVFQAHTEVEMPEKVLDGLLVCRVGDIDDQIVSLVADCPDDCAVLLLAFGQLEENKWQCRVPGLPNLAAHCPAVCRGFIDVDNLPILSKVRFHLPAEQHSLATKLHLRLGGIPATVYFEEAHTNLLVSITQRRGADDDPELPLNQYTPLDQV